MFKGLQKGKWSRPTDKSAVYIEIAPGEKWGIRVTLIDDYAKVEAIDSPNKATYKAPDRYCTVIKPPTLWRSCGITFEDKLMAAVDEKRRVAAEENSRSRSSLLD